MNTVTIYCAGSPPGPHERHDFDKLGIDQHDLVQTRVPPFRSGQFLAGNELFDPMAAAHRQNPLRRRWSWLCPTCGDHLVVTEAKLYPVLRRLADHGVPDVSLSLLRTTL